MDIQSLSLIITIILALAGYIITHQQQLRLMRRQARLALINKRLDEFYGPLFVSTQAGQIVFSTYFKNAEWIPFPLRKVPRLTVALLRAMMGLCNLSIEKIHRMTGMKIMPTEPFTLDGLIAQLQTVPMLQGLPPTSVAYLAERAIRHTYTAGAVIFLEGDTDLAFYLVDSGWVKIVKMSPEGREQILYVWGPGDLFGGVGVFGNRPAPATAIALEATTLWVLPSDVIRQMFMTDPSLALPVIDFMTTRISELIELVAALSLHPVTARLARLLLDRSQDDLIRRRSWATHAEMAARLGTVPDVLSRALRTLVEAGLIQVQRHQIQILDRQGLLKYTVAEQ